MGLDFSVSFYGYHRYSTNHLGINSLWMQWHQVWRKVSSPEKENDTVYMMCFQFDSAFCDCSELYVIANVWTRWHQNVICAAWLQMTIMMITVQLGLLTLMIRRWCTSSTDYIFLRTLLIWYLTQMTLGTASESIYIAFLFGHFTALWKIWYWKKATLHTSLYLIRHNDKVNS